MTIEALIEEIRTMPVEDRKRLIGMIVDTFTEALERRESTGRSILDYEGVAAHLKDGEDPQAHINRLRDEWDDRP